MNKYLTGFAVAAALGASGGVAQAALVNGSTLNFGGTQSCFTMGGGLGCPPASPGFSGQSVTDVNGIVLGTVQAATGTHTGTPNGSETPNIDAAWAFFGNTGLHLTATPTNVMTASGNTATIDFSGWRVSWNGIPSINMGSGAWSADAPVNGVANVTCGVDCGNGDTYTLVYSATVPQGDPSNFGGTKYWLHLTGTVTAAPTVIPVPAAVWLLGSGLLGLVGVARRKKTLAEV